MSSNLVSAISASPSAATTARPRHGAAKQLRIKVKPQLQHAGYWESRGRGRGRGRGRAVVVRAGPGPLTEIEPDLQEDPIDKWRTNGVSPEDFVYGVYDGHHTYHETQVIQLKIRRASGRMSPSGTKKLSLLRAFKHSSPGHFLLQSSLAWLSMYRGSTFTLEQLSSSLCSASLRWISRTNHTTLSQRST